MGKKKREIIKVVWKRNCRCEIDERNGSNESNEKEKSCEISCFSKERRSSFKERKLRICIVYYLKSNLDVRIKWCGIIFYLCICWKVKNKVWKCNDDYGRRSY